SCFVPVTYYYHSKDKILGITPKKTYSIIKNLAKKDGFNQEKPANPNTSKFWVKQFLLEMFYLFNSQFDLILE
ncbi:hypothetical protein ACEW7V_03100, partial [Areca yellow leaf disease phytoplasma]|uniref:hypothetical protein n=1 Tax=Areca yellow leaf disease phytoplasma TaxID=927614 RepID=UPI0035B546DC